MAEKVIMANDLISGDVIFLSRDSETWTEYLNEAWTCESEQLTEQILSLAQQSHTIIGAEAIEVERNNDGLHLTVFREHLRSQGPSVRTDLGKQALRSAA